MPSNHLDREAGGFLVFVTHSVDEAIILSDRIVLLRPRPGQVEEILTVDLPHPRWEYDIHTHPTFVEMRHYLWERIKEMVAADPLSEFAARLPAGPTEKP